MFMTADNKNVVRGFSLVPVPFVTLSEILRCAQNDKIIRMTRG